MDIINDPEGTHIKFCSFYFHISITGLLLSNIIPGYVVKLCLNRGVSYHCVSPQGLS